MELNRYLTKSRFKSAVECPTKLYYHGKKDVYRSLKEEDSFLQALAEGGFQVGKMATMLYPDGIEITERSNSEALRRTQELLGSSQDIVLFEPAFAFESLLVRVDILVKRGDQIELIEVKAKSYDSLDPQIAGKRTSILSGMRPYIEDVAFQKYVVSQALPNTQIRTFLMMPDKSVNACLDGLNQCFKIKRSERSTDVLLSPEAPARVAEEAELLAKVSVDEFVEIVMAEPLEFPGSTSSPDDFLISVVKRWAESYAADRKISPTLHKGCSKCEFRETDAGKLKSGYHECLSEAAKLSMDQTKQGTVLDIWNYRKKDSLLAQGIVLLTQVNDEDIDVKDDKEGLSNSQRQWLQVKGIPPEDDKGGFYFDEELMANLMSGWRYPLHMIDFETSTVALPFFAGMRPYESVAFQFSHHVMHEDGRIEHKSQSLFAEPGKFPNFEFVRALRKSLMNDQGSIFRWATHENTILVHIKEQLLKQNHPPFDRDELVEFINEITDEGPRTMIDLNQVALRTYFHPSTKGRTSIKKVLPVVMGSSEYLKRKYSSPIYGSEISSLNFPRGFVWYEEVNGLVLDPYLRLKTLAKDMLGEDGEDVFDAEDVEIAEGGAAAMAYARLQFEDLHPLERQQIEEALLRYCELDTFAMVMIVEAWREWTVFR
ncbi:MAG: DUF2779 domain-containing protein [Burkholderiaceae bacterium]